MADREAEWEETYEREGTGGLAKFRCYIERHRGSRDQVVVHTYLNIESDDPSEQEHNIWRFWLIDEEDQIAKYKTTRGKSEPSDLALFALQEYGWDCANFDMVTEEEFAQDEAESYRQLGRECLKRAGSLDDPAREDLMVEMWVRAELYAQLTNPDGDGSEMLAAIYGETDGGFEGSIELEIPQFIPPEERAPLSNELTRRFTELAERYSEHDYVLEDERTVR